MNLLGSQLGPYTIEREIGRGGMAIIYLATDTRLHEQVALKVLLEHFAHDPMVVRRFRQEGENGTRLRHPNIVRVLDAGQANGYHYLAMDYAPGGSLAGLLRQRQQAFEINEAIPILRKVGAALDYAHARGILHRDVKPSNVLIGAQGQILLGDFGVARRMAADHTVMTTAGQTVGTPTYMSPEQVNDDINIDHRSDLYSLGVVAYAMLTAALPFDAESQMGLMRKIVDEAPTTPETYNPSLPPGVNFALLKALSKDPKRRYNSAAEFVESVEKGITWTPAAQDWSTVLRALKPIPLQAQSQLPPPPLPPAPARRSGCWWILLLGLLVVAAAIYLLFPFWQTGNLPTLRWLTPPPLATPTLTATETPSLTAQPSATETVPVAAPNATPVAPIAPIVLTTYQDASLQVQLNVPRNWLPLRRGNALYIEAPDQSAWFLIEELPSSASITSAHQLVNNYVRNGIASLREGRILSETLQLVNPASSNEQERYRQQMEASWMGGGRSTLYLLGVLATDRNVILAANADPGQQGILAALVEPVFDSFTLLTVATATPTTTPTTIALPTNTETVRPTDTPSATETALPTATATPSSTPTPTETATLQASATPSATARRLPTATPFPKATATKAPVKEPQGVVTKTDAAAGSTPTNTTMPSETATRTLTPRPAPTVAPLPTNTAQPTATLSPTATATKQPTVTNTHTPTPTATGTATALPTSTATTTRKPTSTPLPTLTPAPTATATPSPIPTSTATATRKPTSTPLPTLTPAPTVTASFTPNPTATATATRKPTSTPLPTLTPAPTVTHTATRKPTSTALPTATPQPTATQTKTSTATPTRKPTATPIPSATPSATATLNLAATVEAAVKLTLEAQPTATATASETPLPTATFTLPPPPTATDTATPQPLPTSTATLPPPTRTPTPVPPTLTPTPIPVVPSVTLIEPLDGVLNGTRTFRWATNVPLAANQGYELVFWSAGGDPMSQGFGPVGYSLSSEVTFDIDKKADSIPAFVSGATYQWGVLLVETNPYRRVQYLGGGHIFLFQRSGGGGGSGGDSGGGNSGGGDSGGGQPAPPSEPPPTETPRA